MIRNFFTGAIFIFVSIILESCTTDHIPKNDNVRTFHSPATPTISLFRYFSTSNENDGAAVGINNNSQIIGDTPNIASLPHAVVWQDGKIIDLDPLINIRNELGSRGTYINNKGEAVGYSITCIDNSGNKLFGVPCLSHAFIWKGKDALTPEPQNEESVALGINDLGNVVGYIGSAGKTRPALWEGRTHIELGGLADYRCGAAVSVNNLNEIVGTSHGCGTKEKIRGFLRRNGELIDLGNLGGDKVLPRSINDKGQIVGSADNKDNVLRAFVWQSGTIKELGTLLDYESSSTIFHLAKKKTVFAGPETCQAVSINNRGQIVGQCDKDGERMGAHARAVLWQNGVTIDLNSLLPEKSGWILNLTYQINDNGQVIGLGVYNGGVLRSVFILTLPESLMLAADSSK